MAEDNVTEQAGAPPEQTGETSPPVAGTGSDAAAEASRESAGAPSAPDSTAPEKSDGTPAQNGTAPQKDVPPPPAAPKPQNPAPQAPPPASSASAAVIRVKWYVDALIDGQVYHGYIKVISLQGTEIYLDLNLQKIKTVRLRIHVPPASKTSPPLLLDVSGKVLFTSYDNKEGLFHIGVHFTEFMQESDRQYLHSRIVAFNKTK